MVRLLSGTPAWRGLLHQEGIPFDTGLPGTDTALLVLDIRPEPGDVGALRGFLGRGGALLSAASHAAPLLPELKTGARRLRALSPDATPLFASVGVVHLDTPGLAAGSANAGDSGRRKAIYFGPLPGGGPGVLLPFELDPLLLDRSTAFRVFPAVAPRPVSEAVARVSRGELRRLVTNCLRWLLGQRGLPLVRLGRSPIDTDSGFGLRVDTDFDSSDHLDQLAALVRQSGIRATVFVNTGARPGSLAADVAKLRGQDIQVHCHRHQVFPTYEDNLANMTQAVELLRTAGIAPEGAAGPFGDWNPSWDRALAQLGIGFSSEFAAGFDDLPFRPLVGGGESSVLQVPVHPIAPDRLLAARADPAQVSDYFRRLIDRQAARQEPCFIYGHPANLGRLSREVQEVIDHGRRACGGSLTMTDYARWWRVRERIRYSARVSGGTLTLETDEARGVDVVVDRGGSQARLRLRPGTLSLDALSWHPVPRPAGFTAGELAVQTGRHWRVVAREMLRSTRRQTTA